MSYGPISQDYIKISKTEHPFDKKSIFIFGYNNRLLNKGY